MKTIYFGKITNPDHIDESKDSAFKLSFDSGETAYFDFKLSFDGETIRIEDSIGRYVPFSVEDFLQLGNICVDTAPFMMENTYMNKVKEYAELDETFLYMPQ